MDSSDACLHPYRKRKFFYGLAEFFIEPRPVIQRLEDFFPAAASHDVNNHELVEDSRSNDTDLREQLIIDESKRTITNSQRSGKSPSSSQESEEDSFEYVEFDKSRVSLDSSASLRTGLQSQSSLHDSMHDSLLFLPPDVNHEVSVALSASDTPRYSEEANATQPTILSLVHTERRAELVDYYDIDRYCEPIPCWAYANQSTCVLHPEPICRPILLFCLQALDEFIASTSMLRTDTALVASCRLARIVFASMWEHDVRLMGSGSDIVIADYVSGKRSLSGVSLDVWKITDSCWLKHKQHFLHHQELYFDDTDTKQPSVRIEQWRRVRHLLQVFGMRPQLARRLEAELPTGTISLSDFHLENYTLRESSLQAIQLGVDYLQHVQMEHETTKSTPVRRDLLSQNDWKVAFSAIEIHLKQWSRDVQVFPCGSFSRGAAFGSIVDVLVGLPEQSSTDDKSPVSRVLQVLTNAKIVDRDSVRQLSQHRMLAIIPFKKASVILDVKVYARPQSWFALLYFTGPESFSHTYFSRLLKRSLGELDVVDFDHIYECAVDQLGAKVVASVDSEKHLFDLISMDYTIPSQRM